MSEGVEWGVFFRATGGDQDGVGAEVGEDGDTAGAVFEMLLESAETELGWLDAYPLKKYQGSYSQSFVFIVTYEYNIALSIFSLFQEFCKQCMIIKSVCKICKC